MKSELPPPAPVLSLQGKLDRIAHDRDVLALLGELARLGLCEGDPVCRTGDGMVGRVAIERQEDPPRIVVATDGGRREPFARELWRRP